jgi:hypothetical protein
VIRGTLFRPQRLHREHLLAHQLASRPERDAMALHLVLVPTESDAEHEASVRHRIERRHLLRRDDGVSLRDETDARAQPHARGHAGRSGECDERIDGALVLLGELGLAGRRRRAAARGNVRVLGKIDRDEPTRFTLARESDGVARAVRHEHRDSELHQIFLPAPSQ